MSCTLWHGSRRTELFDAGVAEKFLLLLKKKKNCNKDDAAELREAKVLRLGAF